MEENKLEVVITKRESSVLTMLTSYVVRQREIIGELEVGSLLIDMGNGYILSSIHEILGGHTGNVVWRE